MASLKKFLGLERSPHLRRTRAVDVAFYIWDEESQKPRTGKATGILSRLTMKGASLQTSTIILGGHHLLLHNSQEGKTPLVLEMPPLPEATPWTLKTQIIWYNRVGSAGARFQFEVGLKFLYLSQEEEQNLRALIKSV